MSAVTGRAPQRERPIRIGEVVRRLGEEFPDISISKIRFLEEEGLLSPQRTRGGYRLFSEHDVDFVCSHSDRMVAMDLGQVVASGSPDEVRSAPRVIAAYLGEPVPA